MQRRTVGRGQGKGQTIDFDRQDQLFHSSCLSGTVQRRMSTSTAERERERKEKLEHLGWSWYIDDWARRFLASEKRRS